MKIKKSVKTPGNAGGAAINDRLRLDPVAPKNVSAAGTVNRKAATIAFVAGVIALVLVGILTYVLYDHWEFLKGA